MDRETYLVKDAALTVTKALPDNGATANSAAFDLGALSSRGARLESMEILIEAPALNATQLANASTMTYCLEGCATNFGTPVILADKVLVQTGSAGAAATTGRVKIPSNCSYRYVRVHAANSSTGNCAAATMTVSAVF